MNPSHFTKVILTLMLQSIFLKPSLPWPDIAIESEAWRPDSEYSALCCFSLSHAAWE